MRIHSTISFTSLIPKIILKQKEKQLHQQRWKEMHRTEGQGLYLHALWQFPRVCVRGPLSSLKAPVQASPPPQHLLLQTGAASLSWFHVKISSWLPSYSLVSESSAEIVLFFFLRQMQSEEGLRSCPPWLHSSLAGEQKLWCKWLVPGDTGAESEVIGNGHLALLLQIQEEQLPGVKRWAHGCGCDLWLRKQHSLDFLGQLRHSTCLLCTFQSTWFRHEG